jgi:hypothetical protein
MLPGAAGGTAQRSKAKAGDPRVVFEVQGGTGQMKKASAMSNTATTAKTQDPAYDRLLDELKRAKGVLDTLTPERLSDLSDDDFYIVVSTWTKFFNSVRSLADRLAVLHNNA